MGLDKLITYRGSRGPVLLVVMDGVGLAPPGPGNAVAAANTPTLDKLFISQHFAKLNAHGTHVGMPSDSDMGNSEVGHNTLGGGRVFAQGAKLVQQAIDSGAIFNSDNWGKVVARGKKGCVHFLGLLSDGGVHSHINHLLALLEQSVVAGLKKVRVHALLDGRDVAPRSALKYLTELQTKLDAINSKSGFDYQLASAGGRMMMTMDRYGADWAMVKRGFDAHVHGEGAMVKDARAEVQRQYDADDNLDDQFLSAFIIVDDDGKAVGRMQDKDAVVLFNFRGDRAIEISRALEEKDFKEFERGKMPDLFFCGMLQYDGDLNIPNKYLVAPPLIDKPMMEFLCAENLKTFAVSETQKFGHVTYFFNGNRSGYIDDSLEKWVEIASDNIDFSKAPAMKAVEITDATIEILQSGEYRFGRINFANGDMVGHSGNVAATIRAMEVVDAQIGRLQKVVEELQGVLIVTADHGNADEMIVEKDGEQIVRTAHSLNPVPFAIYDSQNSGAYKMAELDVYGLANVAATVFNLLGYRAPSDYMRSLIEFSGEPHSSRLLHGGVVVNFNLETAKMPNGEMVALEVVRHPGGAVVVACDKKNDVALIRQFRHATGGWIWEFPAGTLEDGEAPLTAAKRELAEETGCTAKKWEDLGSILTAPGFCSERLYLFKATEITKSQAALQENEFIEVHWKPLDEVAKMVHSGEIDDAKTIAMLFHLIN